MYKALSLFHGIYKNIDEAVNLTVFVQLQIHSAYFPVNGEHVSDHRDIHKLRDRGDIHYPSLAGLHLRFRDDDDFPLAPRRLALGITLVPARVLAIHPHAGIDRSIKSGHANKTDRESAASPSVTLSLSLYSCNGNTLLACSAETRRRLPPLR